MTTFSSSQRLRLSIQRYYNSLPSTKLSPEEYYQLQMNLIIREWDQKLEPPIDAYEPKTI